MKLKIEFLFTEDIGKQIKDFNIPEEKVKEYERNKDKYHKKMIDSIEKSIKTILEWEDYAYVKDFKTIEVEENNGVNSNNNQVELAKKLIEKRKDDKYQKALNDVISNAGTKFNCNSDSFWLLQELVDNNIKSEIARNGVIE